MLRRSIVTWFSVACMSLAACNAEETTDGSSATASPLVANGLSALLTISSDWGNGYCADVALQNVGSSTITAWEVRVGLNGATLQNGWSATFTTSGTSLVAKPASHNATLTSGSKANFGFCVNATSGSARASVVSVVANGTGGTASGGASATGGTTAKGGSTAKGGTTAAGGSTAKGGTTAAGGSTAKGGSSSTGGSATSKRYRYIHSSDFPPIPVTNSDPDDVQTVVRLALYANELDIEAFIASAGTYGMVANKKNLETVWAAYEKVYSNLKKHDANYPTAAYLRGITYEGKGNNNGVSIQWGCNKQAAESLIGAGKDSEASNAIIAIADKPDPRPIWIGVAGGGREVAQAIWKVKSTRSATEYKSFISKLRVFLIACQDGTHQYLMGIPELFVIESKSTYLAFFCGGGANCNLSWVNTNIRNNHGPLGTLYPEKGSAVSGVQEGDSPVFMHLISAIRGINNPENPAQAGWGGQYRRDGSTNHWLDGSGASITSGRDKYQAEFATRADWMVQ